MTAPAPQSSMEIAREMRLPSEIILSEARWNDLHTIIAAALDAARASERERCLAICQRIAQRYENEYAERGEFDTDMERVAQECAAAIRALDTPVEGGSNG